MRKMSVCLLAPILLILLLLLGVYFSYPVGDLATKYPHRDGENYFVLKEQQPVNWVNLSRVSNYAKEAIRISEDWAFYQHSGIDVRQLKIVLEESLDEGKLTRGASTISQQVVKNVFLTHEKTLWRKFKEYILTYKLERNVSKKRILEVYLNIVEFGPDIYGIAQASRHYFGVSPKNLTPRQGAFLAFLLPSPVRYSSSFRKGELSKFAKETVGEIISKMERANILTEEQKYQALNSRFHWEKWSLSDMLEVNALSPDVVDEMQLLQQVP